MSGFAFVTSPCIGCGRTFSYNPLRVPSVIVDGHREPICKVCVEVANPIREARGLDPIVPFADAYEPCAAEELF